MELTLPCRIQYLNDLDPFDPRANLPEPVRPITYVFLTNVPLCNQISGVKRHLGAPHSLEDCALQISKISGAQLEFGSYLDLESTLDDQQEELEDFRTSKRNVIILRTQLSVRVQACIEKLLCCSSKDLKKYLLTLKQIFQDDKDLVHEFVNNQGLDCLIKVSQQADNSSINYVLKALGQIMLYVDGMNGVIGHNRTIQWLYSLINLQIRPVIKMSLKLLLVFVEYNDSNWQLLMLAITAVDSTSSSSSSPSGTGPWSSLMKLLKDGDMVESEMLVYAMTLVNKTLATVPDQDTFYDITDSLEKQGMEEVMRKFRESQNKNRELLDQFNIYDSLVSFEDGDVSPQDFASSSRRLPKVRSSEDMKRTRRRSAEVSSLVTNKTNKETQLPLPSPTTSNGHLEDVKNPLPSLPKLYIEECGNINAVSDKKNVYKSHLSLNSFVSVSDKSKEVMPVIDNDANKTEDDSLQTSITTGLSSQTVRPNMSRRLRRQRQQSQIMEMIQISSSSSSASSHQDEILESLKNDAKINESKADPESILPRYKNTSNNTSQVFFPNLNSTAINPLAVNASPHEHSTNNDPSPLRYAVDLDISETFETCGPLLTKQHENVIKKNSNNEVSESCRSGDQKVIPTHQNDKSLSDQLVSSEIQDMDIKWNLSKIGKNVSLDETKHSSMDGFQAELCATKNQLKPHKPLKKHDSDPPVSAISKFCSAFAKPFKGLNKIIESRADGLQWSVIEKECAGLPLMIKDSDFTDLTELDEQDYLTDSSRFKSFYIGTSVDPMPHSMLVPPPPPPLLLPNLMAIPPPPIAPSLSHLQSAVPPPPPPPMSLGALPEGSTIRKKMKLHWREARSKFATPKGVQLGTIWEEVKKEVGDVRIDQNKFEHLFEIRTQDVKTKKSDISKKELSILDQKRSNAINICMVHLPKPSAIKNAILAMDNSVLTREDIEKILVGMVPTEEEKSKIVEIQRTNDSNDLQLGTAEQFLLTMGSISELESRLRLWIFKLDYDTIESEICDPLFDLKKGIEELKRSKTFKFILSTLLSVGNFLNNSKVSGFTVDYLVRVIEVKDNVYRHTLLHHLVNIILDTFPDSSDLYSEIGSITRCAKVDWDDLKEKLTKLEENCISSWEDLNSIEKHDLQFQTRHKMLETLKNFAKRIVLVKIVYRRVLNRFKKFLLWLGYSCEEARTVTVGQLCQGLGEFALEYRTTREKVLNMRLKKANMKERKKTRGVMIVQTEKFVAKANKLPVVGEDSGQDDLESLLQNDCHLNPVKFRARRSLDPKTFQKSLAGFKPVAGDISPTPTSEKIENENIEGEKRNDADQSMSINVISDGPEDDLLDAVLRSVTSTNEPKTRERRRARNADRKSLRRTLKSGLSLEEADIVSKFA